MTSGLRVDEFDARGHTRRFGWRERIAVLVAGLTLTSTVAIAIAPRATAATQDELNAAAGVVTFASSTLKGLVGVAELADTIGGTDLVPTDNGALDLADTLDGLAAVITAVPNKTEAAVEDALDGTHNLGPVTVEIDADLDLANDRLTFDTFQIRRTVSAPLNFATGELGTPDYLTLAGGALTGDIVLDLAEGDADLVLAFSAVDSKLASLVAPVPDIALTVDLELTGTFESRLGILDVTASAGDFLTDFTPAAASSLDVGIEWLDPDGSGTITVTELTTSAPTDLWSAELEGGAVRLDVELSAALEGLSGVTGTVTLDDDDLGNGLDAPDFQLGQLADFTNWTPQDVLTALAQLALSMRGMELKFGNIDLPLIDENLAELGNWADKITKLFTELNLSTAENPVDLVNVDENTLANAGENGLLTLENIVAELEKALEEGGSDLDLGLQYIPADRVVTFHITQDDTDFFHGGAPTAAVNVAEELASAGITGLALDGGASLTIEPSYSLDLTVGLDMADPPSLATPITDRIFIEFGDGPEFSLDVPISGDLDLRGMIGFLEIDLADTDPGSVDLLAPADPAEPMFAVDLVATGEDDRFTLTELFDATGGPTVANPSPGVFEIDLGNGAKIQATGNLAVPALTLAATSSIPGLENLAGATVTFGWPNIFTGSPSVSTSPTFDDDLLSFNLSNDDPLALFNTIMQGIEAAFGALDSFDAAGMDEELPIVGTSLSDALEFLGEVRDALNTMATNPSGSLQQLELQANLLMAVAVDKLDGVDDLTGVPALPDQAQFIDGEGNFDEVAYGQAFSEYLAALEAFVGDQADFLDLEYVPGNSPGAILLKFDIGVCSDKAEYEGCVFEYPIEKPFNLDLGEFGGGLIGAGAEGSAGLDYNVTLHAHLGIELPEVTEGTGGGLPGITGTPQLFILDSSGITGDIVGFAEGSIGATIGPFEVSVGDPVGRSETACDDNVDDDADGKVNDGCPPVDIGESDAQCADALDAEEDRNDEDEIPADGKVNDGCPPVSNPMDAQAGVALSLTESTADPNDPQREYDIAGFIGGLDFDATPAADCDDNGGTPPTLACASLPVYFGVDEPLYLGTIEFNQADFSSTPTLTGEDDVYNALVANAESFVWQLIGDGIKAFGDYVADSLKAEQYDAEMPVLGDLMDAGAEVGAAFKTNITDPIGDLVGSLDSAGDFPTVESEIRSFFYEHLGPDGANLLLHPADIVTDEDTATPAVAEDIDVQVLCGNDQHECAGDDTFANMSDVQVSFKMGQVASEETPKFDLGVPGLRLQGTDGALSAAVTWQLNVGFGISLKDGFYLLTERPVDAADATDGTALGEELKLTAQVGIGEPTGSGGELGLPSGDPAILGDIAFLGVDIYNAKSDDAPEVAMTLTVDIPNPSASDHRIGLTELVEGLDPTEWDIELDAIVDLYVTLVTSLRLGDESAEAAIPKLMADLSLDWTMNGSITEGFDFGEFEVAFGNVRLDLGSFIAEFLAPVLEEIQRVTKPLQPVIDTLQAPIPGISQIAELVGADPVTLLSLMELISDSDLTLIKTLLDVITLANSIPTNVAPAEAGGSTSLVVPLSDLIGLDETVLQQPELPSTEKAAVFDGAKESFLAGGLDDGVFGSSQFQSLDGDFKSNMANSSSESEDDAGFSFPAFENPSELFGLLVGENPTLVYFDAGPLKAEVSKSFFFGPITIGPVPVSVSISVGAAVEGHFAMGYDTKGIRQMIMNLTDDDESNDGFYENLGVLFAGVFIDDLKDGVDVPEIRLTLEAAVGAAVDLVIVKVGVEAGVRATLDLNLHDGGWEEPVPPEDLDGKLRIDEIISIIKSNPICLFDVDGKLEAFIRFFVTIDFYLFEATFKQTIINIVLLELKDLTKDLCEPPPPVLAERLGDGTLVLNMGERAGMRNYDEENPDEKFTLRQMTDEVQEGQTGHRIQVTAFGIVQEYDDVVRVVGSGSSGKDTIKTEEGPISGICQSDGTVTPDLPGVSEMLCGQGDEFEAEAGETVTKQIRFATPLIACGGIGGGGDVLGGGDANDVLYGDGALADDHKSCTRSIFDDDEGDKIAGGAGDDDIFGGNEADDAEGDDLSGDAGDDEIDAGLGHDVVTGGEGKDILKGGPGNDHVMGGPEADPCSGSDTDTCSDVADDHIEGNQDLDTLEGDHGRDTILGGSHADILVGGLGSDDLNGESGDDRVFGNQGDDVMRGWLGDDDLVGGVGDDEIYGDLGTFDIGDPEIEDDVEFAIIGGDDDIVGEAGNDTVKGGAGMDVIIGDLGSINRNPDAGGFISSDPNLPLVQLLAGDPLAEAEDDLNGGEDADLIYGQEDDDTIHGDGGDDELHGQQGGDTVSGDAGRDTIDGDDGEDTLHGDDPTGSHGTDDLDDTIRGGPGNDEIEGNDDGDSLFGNGGRDTIYGDALDEGAACGNDKDTIRGGPDGDYLFGNADDDTIDGDGGDDRIVGGSDSADVCDGTDGISGGTDEDVIAGDNATIGDAVLEVLGQEFTVPDGMLVTLRLDGEGAADTIHGDSTADTPYEILAVENDDRIFGEVGDDDLFGDAGDDYVEGNEAMDTIDGGSGNDDLIGGSSAGDGVVDADRNGSGRPDDVDTIDGSGGIDWIAGDNALVSRNVVSTGRADVELFDVEVAGGAAVADTVHGPDVINGGVANDRVFGQGAADTIHGDGGDDYLEGNHADDTVYGDEGDDDIVGGGSANDGVIDADRVGTTLLDVGETRLDGGTGEDWITGDNALVDRNMDKLGASVKIRLFDVFTVPASAAAGTSGGEVLITGGDGPDWIFGQGGDDTIHGDAGDDYVEGNEGDDSIYGDADDDDLVGGSSADDGVIDDDRVGKALRDGGETLISGGTGIDWITGDNALVNRNRPTSPEAGRAPIELFDVQLAGGAGIPATVSGGDFITGDEHGDRIFGQGNGAQPLTQRDASDQRNNDFIFVAPTQTADPDYDRSTGTADEDAAGWLGDVIYGGTGDDEVEGNHGNDLIFGNAPGASADANDDEDDIVGGGSADDGRIFPEARLNVGTGLLDGHDVIHGDGADATAGDDDEILADNGWIRRTGAVQVGDGPEVDEFDAAIEVNFPVRLTETGIAPAPGTYGNDYVAGNGGHDEIIGQAGDDALNGEYGSDALLGDLGIVDVDLLGNEGPGESNLCGDPATIEPNEPFISAPVCQPGTLFRRVELFAADDSKSGVVAGKDVILGGDGDDWVHGGAGADLINGDGDGGPEIVPDPEFTYTQGMTDPNPGSADFDRIFGGDSNGNGTVGTIQLGDGDNLWGGRGNDHLYGGHGADNHEVRPAVGDPYPDTWSAWAEADVESYHGVDFIYGGWGRDAMQANVADTGPVTGDRVMDWAGVYNLTLLCPATYGAYVTIRDQSPDLIEYWQDSANFDGAKDVYTAGSSGYRELAMVFKPDIKKNNNPVYPNTPGHFFSCGP